MLNDEITTIKEELLKEIRSVENKLNLQILVKYQEVNEKNQKFMEEFRAIFEKNKMLHNTLTAQSINLEKINDFDNFRKKMESMTITHEIRINNSMNDIKNIQFKMGKEIENLTVPGYIGPTSKYKTLASYISSNINDLDKIKNDNETIKKDNKEIKKKVEDLLKTVISLVDGSTNKCIEYTDKHIKRIDEYMKKKMDEFSEKLVNFKSLLLTQEKIDKMNESVFRTIQSDYYDKKEIDYMINNVNNNFGNNMDSLKADINEQINNMIKISNENLENEIKENIKSIKDINMKIIKINQFQNQISKNNFPIKNLLFNNNEQSFNNSSRNNIKVNSSFNSIKHNANEEEKYSKFRKVDSLDKYRTIDSIDDIKNKNNNNINYRSSEPNQFRGKNNPINIIDNYQNKKTDIFKKDSFKNTISKFDKTKQGTNYNNVNSEENKTSFSDYKNKLDSSNNKSDLSNNKIDIMKTDMNNSPYKFKSSVLDINNKNIESKNKRSSFSKKNLSDKNKIISKNSNISNMLSFGINNQKDTITSIDITNNKEEKDEKNGVIKIFADSFEKEKNMEENKDRNGTITIKRRGYSLHKIAAIGIEEKINEVLPKVRTLSNKNLKCKNKKPHTPVIKKVFDEKYQFAVNNKIKDNLTIDGPVKIISSFGRTGYTFYNKKEEGINNLINKGINNKIKKFSNNSLDLNIELSPVTKIKVYGNV